MEKKYNNEELSQIIKDPFIEEGETEKFCEEQPVEIVKNFLRNVLKSEYTYTLPIEHYIKIKNWIGD